MHRLLVVPVLVLGLFFVAPNEAAAQQDSGADRAPVEAAPQDAPSVTFERFVWHRVGGPRSIASRLLRQVGELDGVPVYVEAALTGPISLVRHVYLPGPEPDTYHAFRRNI